MTRANDKSPTRGLPVQFAAGIALSIVLGLGTVASPARAEEHRGDHREDHRWDHRGGAYYYHTPPVVYGPGYYPPPVVYGPGIGINLPGVSIGIR